MNQVYTIDRKIADLQERTNALLAEKRALQALEGKVTSKRKRRTKTEMERDVTSAIRYLLDEEHNGATQSGAEKRFGLPDRTLSRRKWSDLIEKYRKMR